MALSTQAVESMLQAMSIISTSQLNTISYDKTIVCTIVDRSAASKQSYYMVTDGSTRFKAYVQNTQEAEEYDVDDQVYVKIPNGDFSKKKIIEGYYVSEETMLPSTYTSPFDTFLDMANLTSEADGSQSSISEGLIANHTAAIPLWQWSVDKTKKNTADDLQANGIYDTLGIQADFKCLLNTYNMRAGSYGLRLDLYVRLSAKSEKHVTKSIYLDSSEMFGNPYAFTIFATQAKTFDISSLGTVDGMTLWFYQNNDFVYFDGEQEKFLEVDSRLLTPNIFVNNVYIAFGSEMAEITDNTIKLYTTNDLSFKQTEPNDTNNTKTLGFLWYNKTQEGKYIGFSDGVVDFVRNADGSIKNPNSPQIDPYDELEYLQLSAVNNRLVEQMGKEVPKDENGLNVSASVAEAKDLLRKSYLLMQTDLVNTLKAFKERVNGLNIYRSGNTTITATDFFSAQNTGKINVAMKYGQDLETYTDDLMEWMDEAFKAAAAIQKHQTDKTTPETKKEVVSANLYSSTIKNLLKNLIGQFYTTVNNGTKREFLFNDLRTSITNNYSGFQSVYDTYKEKLNKIFTTLEDNFAEIDTLLKDAEKNMTSTNQSSSSSQFHYKFNQPIETYGQKDFSNYHNRYCVYWYRYKNGHVDPDGLMDDGWERIVPGSTFKDSSYSTTQMPANLGLSTGYEVKGGVNYFLPKLSSGEGYLNVYLNPKLAEEKFKVVLYYNHEKFVSNELVFTNLDPVVDDTTLDSNDAITIMHGQSSLESYQTLYAANNSLTNARDGSMKRGLTLKYDGVLGGNENLAGAQIFWYVPRNATMLTVDVNDLKSTYGFSTDYYRVAKFKKAVTAKQGPGSSYKDATGADASYAANTIVDAVYDQQNGWYSLRNTNSIGTTGRWVNSSDVEIIDNEETYMDGFACFYKTIPFTEKEVDVYDETDSTKVIGKKTVKEVDEASLQFFYKIKNYYTATFLKNTVFCIIKKDEYKFETSISFVFGTQGTSGTDYTVLVTPSGSATSVVGTKILPVHIKAYNYDNDEIEIKTTTTEVKDGTIYNPTITWFGPTTFSMAQLSANDSTQNVVNSGEFSEIASRVASSNKGQFNRCGVAKINVTMYDSTYGGAKTLTTLYPVAWSAGDYYIEGASSIVYDSSGGNPTYYKDSYRIFRTNTNEELTDVTWDIKYFMLNDATKAGYAPKYMFDSSNQVWDVSSNWTEASPITPSADLRKEINFYLKYVPKLSEGDNKLVPSNNYITGTYSEATGNWTDLNMYPVVCCYRNGTQIWAQPIAISQNRYPNSMINHWDGKFAIDEENGTILSTMVGAGYKNTDNTYSGVLMGDIEARSVSADNKDGIGLYGYHHGAQSFGLNIDGTAFFGKSGRGRILFNGNSGTISSASYQQNKTNGDAGMMIDLDDGFIDMYGTTQSNTGAYTPDGTRSHIKLNVKAPYFTINSAAGHRLLNIGTNDAFNSIAYTPGEDENPFSGKGYYFKSDDFLPSKLKANSANTAFEGSRGAGLLFDLAGGRLEGYSFSLKGEDNSDNYYGSSINISSDATSFLKIVYKNANYITDDWIRTVMQVGNVDYYFHSFDWVNNMYGMEIDMANNHIMAYHEGNTNFNKEALVINSDADSLYPLAIGYYDTPTATNPTPTPTAFRVGWDGKLEINGSCFKVDAYGNLSLGNGAFKVDNQGNLAINTDKFKVDKLGNLSINDTAFKVDNLGNLSINSTAFTVDNTGNLSINGKFKVDNQGNLSINGDTFKVTSGGVLTATSGYIGGWQISSGVLKSGNIKITPSNSTTNVTASISGGTGIKTWSIKNDGSVSFTSGTIGGWYLTSTTLSSTEDLEAGITLRGGSGSIHHIDIYDNGDIRLYNGSDIFVYNGGTISLSSGSNFYVSSGCSFTVAEGGEFSFNNGTFKIGGPYTKNNHTSYIKVGDYIGISADIQVMRTLYDAYNINVKYGIVVGVGDIKIDNSGTTTEQSGGGGTF